MNQKESVDHISCTTWVGDTITANCDLPSCWSQGRENAMEILKKSKVPPTSYNFETLFSSGSGIDILCVFGDAKYPSINDAKDHEDLVDVLTTRVCPTAQTTMEDVQVGAQRRLTLEELAEMRERRLTLGLMKPSRTKSIHSTMIPPLPTSNWY